ncbi:MAG TPA: metallophosphoesterase family protein, partial [Roseomonas sp.]|nr:metallophosphoesterase family protein [Roseomonas sp.]
MRLAVISDIHGNLPALEAVLADIEERGADAIVNLGDCVTGPLWPRETFECLAALDLPTVRGNHDRWIVEKAEADLTPAGRFARDALTGSRVFQIRCTLAPGTRENTSNGPVMSSCVSRGNSNRPKR